MSTIPSVTQQYSYCSKGYLDRGTWWSEWCISSPFRTGRFRLPYRSLPTAYSFNTADLKVGNRCRGTLLCLLRSAVTPFVRCTHRPWYSIQQTTDLRLPRKSPYSINRILHPRPASDTCRTGSMQAKADRNDQPQHVHTKATTATSGTDVEEGNETGDSDSANRYAERKSSGVVGTEVLDTANGRIESLRAAGRTHVRVGGEGVKDAGIGQQPTVWTVAERTPNKHCESFPKLPSSSRGRFIRGTRCTRPPLCINMRQP